MFRLAGVHDCWYEYSQYLPLSASDDISVVSVGDELIKRQYCANMHVISYIHAYDVGEDICQ